MTLHEDPPRSESAHHPPRRERLWLRVVLFCLLFVTIWALAALADERSCRTDDHSAPAPLQQTATAGNALRPARDTPAGDGSTAHEAIAAGAAVLVVTSFLLTIGTYRWHVEKGSSREQSPAAQEPSQQHMNMPRGGAVALALMTAPVALMIHHIAAAGG